MFCAISETIYFFLQDQNPHLYRDYCEELRDSLDLVPIGAWHGNGRKVGWYSPFLLAAYDPDTEEFQSVCRCMSGYTDAFYAEASLSLVTLCAHVLVCAYSLRLRQSAGYIPAQHHHHHHQRTGRMHILLLAAYCAVYRLQNVAACVKLVVLVGIVADLTKYINTNILGLCRPQSASS